jgi:hypothetical protein
MSRSTTSTFMKCTKKEDRAPTTIDRATTAAAANTAFNDSIR